MFHRVTSWLLYLAAAILLTVVVTRDFALARKLGHPAPPNTHELVSSRRPTFTRDQTEHWQHGPDWFESEGLSALESAPLEPGPWRHGLAPATRLTFAPGHHAANIAWEFNNPTAGQQLTLRLDGAVVRRETVALGRHTGTFPIPASAGCTELAFEFDRAIPPGADPRRITVTFLSLRVEFP